MSAVKNFVRNILGMEIVRQVINECMCWKYSRLKQEEYPEELARIYKRKFGYELDLNNPQSYNEKIQWMKLYDNTALKTRLADKYLMKEYVANKVGERYIVPLLGVWENPDEIDFDSLPDRFVLKTNNSCHTNIIVHDKSKLDTKKAKKQLKKWLHIKAEFLNGFEMQYRDIPPVVIAEEYIDCGTEEPDDYKVWCFEGKAYYVQYLTDRVNGLKMAFFDMDWNKMPFTYSYPLLVKEVNKPDNFDEMIRIAEQLAQGLHHVRVDFYILPDQTLKIGELTFTSAGGMCRWNSVEYDRKLGELIDLERSTEEIGNE